MNNVTKMKILKPANDVFEAFVDPHKIGNFWFSLSSERWEQGKTITLRYDEYDAQSDIKIIKIEDNKKIAFRWGANGEGHLVTILLHCMKKPSPTRGLGSKPQFWSWFYMVEAKRHPA